MRSEKIYFKNKEGQKLAAYIDQPISGKTKVYAVFAHCFTCNKNLKAIQNISHSLTKDNIAVLRFDFTGLGQSEGEFSDTNFSSNVNDLIAAAEYLDKNYNAPALLVGHSLGGAAAILAAGELESVKAVVTIGAPSELSHVVQHFEEDRSVIEEKGEAKVNIGGRPFTIKKQFLKNIEGTNMGQKIRRLNKALLILHSPQDKIVGIENAARIYQLAMHPKSYISLDGADHLLSKKEDSLYTGSMIGAWVTRYLHTSEDEETKLRSEKQVLVRTGEKGFFTEILAGKHALQADEPESYGGTDLGPTPYDLLAAGLGACTSMTLRMYADRKKWDLKEVTVHMQHDKIHAEDCEGCEEDQSKRVDRFERQIEVKGDLDQDQKKRLLEIADKCPVHKTLTSDIVIKTVLSIEY